MADRSVPWKSCRLIIAALAVSAAAGGAAAAQPASMTPRDFEQAAAQSNQYEIAAAEVATAESQDPRVRSFAQEMIADHTRMDEAIRHAAIASQLPPPDPGMGGDHARMLAALQSLTGPEFDRLYVKQQVLAHQEAMAVGQGFATSGSDPNLVRAAQGAAPIIQHHLEMAQQLQASLGGS